MCGTCGRACTTVSKRARIPVAIFNSFSTVEEAEEKWRVNLGRGNLRKMRIGKAQRIKIFLGNSSGLILRKFNFRTHKRLEVAAHITHHWQAGRVWRSERHLRSSAHSLTRGDLDSYSALQCSAFDFTATYCDVCHRYLICLPVDESRVKA